MRNDPIVLFGSPRGGTSLAAGCFVNHGFWVGKTFGGPKGIGSGGYVNYENDSIKKFCKDNWKLNAGHLMQNVETADLFNFCRKIVPDDTPWLFKGPTEYYPIFAKWFPDMTPVFVFRNEHQAIEAVVRRRGEQERDHAAEIIKSRYRIQNQLLDELDFAFRLDADTVVKGDYGQVETVLATYGIDLNEVDCGRHIDASQWHA
jgi:hypothetical protein